MIRVFIQARMSSSRFPGKVLAPISGRPIIGHVYDRVTRVMPKESIVVATSDSRSDDPLVAYLKDKEIQVFRGVLDDVFARFRTCLDDFPCSWFFRICADSPYIDERVISTMLPYSSNDELDLVTNVMPRTFPKGQSVEMINSSTFLSVDQDGMTDAEKEHVTTYFYERPDEYMIHNIESSDPSSAKINYSVDTVEDLERLEGLNDDFS